MPKPTLLSTGQSGTKFTEIWFKIQIILRRNLHLKVLSAKYQQFYSGLNVSNQSNQVTKFCKCYLITHGPRGYMTIILPVYFSNLLYRTVVCLLAVKCRRTWQMRNQHWFRQWHQWQQAITWANVDPDLSRHMTSVNHDGLMAIFLESLLCI